MFLRDTALWGLFKCRRFLALLCSAPSRRTVPGPWLWSSGHGGPDER